MSEQDPPAPGPAVDAGRAAYEEAKRKRHEIMEKLQRETLELIDDARRKLDIGRDGAAPLARESEARPAPEERLAGLVKQELDAWLTKQLPARVKEEVHLQFKALADQLKTQAGVGTGAGAGAAAGTAPGLQTLQKIAAGMSRRRR